VLAPDGHTYEVRVEVDIEVTCEPTRWSRRDNSDDNQPATPAERTPVQVIKEGRKQTGWSQQLECTGAGNGGGGCGAMLLVEIGDVFETQSSCRDETDYYVTFRCQCCGVLTDIKGAPGYVRDAARVQRAKWRTP